MAIFYVDFTTGDDADSGLTEALAWKTIAKVNASTFAAGDSVLFKRGETWREQLTVPSSGSAGLPITFGAYGTGDLPKIYGSTQVTGWDQDDIPGGIVNYGDTAAPGTPDLYAADYIYGHKVTSAISGTVGSIKVYFSTTDKPTTGNVKCALYSDSSGPNNLLTNGTTAELAWSTITGGQWTTFTFSAPPSVTASTVYWMCVWSSTGFYQKAKVSGGSNNWSGKGAAYGTWPSPLGYDFLQSYSDNDVYMVVTGDSIPLPADSWKASCTPTPAAVWFVAPITGIVTWGTKETVLANVNAEYDWYADGTYLIVYAATTPDTRYASVEASKRDGGIKGNSKDYIIIENAEIAYAGKYGINTWVGGENWIIQDNTIHHISIKVDEYADGILIQGSNCQVLNNVIHNVGTHGIYILANGATDSTIDCVVRDNEIYDCYHTCIDIHNITAGGTCSGHIIERNFLFSTSSYSQPIVTCNGIFMEGVSGAVIDDCQLSYNFIINMISAGIQIYDSITNCNIYNNTIYGTNALNTTLWTEGIVVNGSGVSGINIKNNIVMDIYSGAGGGDNCLYVPDSTDISTCDNNLWYQSAGGTRVYTKINGISYHYDDFAAYKSATGWDTNGFWEDPKFVNAGGANPEDYKLASNSPCIDAGTNVGLTTDYFGNAVPDALVPDIGAYEIYMQKVIMVT